MNKPNALRTIKHTWNGDAKRSDTIIVALFDNEQTNVPTGWERATRYEYVGPYVAYIKTFPYGTTVRNGHIIV